MQPQLIYSAHFIYTASFHIYSLISYIQPHLIYTASFHIYSLISYIQPHFIYAASSHIYSLISYMQPHLIYTAPSHIYSLISYIQPHLIYTASFNIYSLICSKVQTGPQTRSLTVMSVVYQPPAPPPNIFLNFISGSRSNTACMSSQIVVSWAPTPPDT